MKKILTFALIAILFVLISAPSFVNAATFRAQGYIYYMGESTTLYELYGSSSGTRGLSFSSGGYLYSASGNSMYVYVNGSYEEIKYDQFTNAYIPTLQNYTAPYVDRQILTYNNTEHIVFKNEQDYIDNFPAPPTWSETLWNDFIDFLEFQIGLDPFDGGIWNFFKRYFEDPENESLEITFPTNTPTPTPTPRPTPIPVQTIYVPDGNGSYTIIYQYPDPSGTITQSPYNPNIDVNVDVDCDCDGGSQNYNPQDPMYAPLEGLRWSSPDGELTGSPAMSASQSLDAIKAEVDSYDEPIKVVSNSFGVLPGKWLSLVGLLGACLIVAGLIRTFLGG